MHALLFYVFLKTLLSSAQLGVLQWAGLRRVTMPSALTLARLRAFGGSSFHAEPARTYSLALDKFSATARSGSRLS